MNKIWKKVDDATKRGLVVDKKLNNFLRPVFVVQQEREVFIKDCLKRTSTRRMLLRSQWYTEIADDQKKVRLNRPALRIIFLIALAEALAKKRLKKKNMKSFEAIKEFFKYITAQDKALFLKGFRRTLLYSKHHNLRFSSVVKVLYDIRNRAVHGEDYYSFSILDKKRKKEYDIDSSLTFAFLGNRNRKRKVSLDIALTYEDLRNIFRRTAIENIKSLL